MPDDDNGNGNDSLKGPVALQIAAKLGAVGADVKTLTHDVRDIKDKMVTRLDCERHMKLVEERLEQAEASAEGAEAEAAEAAEIASQVREVTGRHRIPSAEARPAAAPAPPVVPPWWSKLGEHSKIIAQVVAAAVAVGGILLLAARFVAKLDAAVKRIDDQQQQTIRKLQPIYMWTTGADAGPPHRVLIPLPAPKKVAPAKK